MTFVLVPLLGACASGGARPSVSPPIPGCGTEASAAVEARYLLPFAPGEAFTLTQGNCGTASHADRFRYSFDFRMPMGTPVLAARDGVVETVRDDRPDGTRRTGDENFVILRHADGEFSRYIHLRREGVFVAKGTLVAAGDTIALSGNSGRSGFPHLHFDVARGCDAGRCETIPSAFVNADPPVPTSRAPVRALAPTARTVVP